MTKKQTRKHPDFLYDFADAHIAYLRDRRILGKDAADNKHAASYVELHEQALGYLRDDPARDRLGMRKSYSVRGVSMHFRPGLQMTQVSGTGDRPVKSPDFIECFLTPSGRKKVEADS